MSESTGLEAARAKSKADGTYGMHAENIGSVVHLYMIAPDGEISSYETKDFGTKEKAVAALEETGAYAAKLAAEQPELGLETRTTENRND